MKRLIAGRCAADRRLHRQAARTQVAEKQIGSMRTHVKSIATTKQKVRRLDPERQVPTQRCCGTQTRFWNYARTRVLVGWEFRIKS